MGEHLRLSTHVPVSLAYIFKYWQVCIFIVGYLKIAIITFCQCVCLSTDLEATLLSFERLDRASPELWPEQSKTFHQECVCVSSA